MISMSSSKVRSFRLSDSFLFTAKTFGQKLSAKVLFRLHLVEANKRARASKIPVALKVKKEVIRLPSALVR